MACNINDLPESSDIHATEVEPVAVRHVIHELSDPHGPGFRLEVGVTRHRAGTTLDVFTIHPGARVPDPHRKLSLTLPPEAFARLATVLHEIANDGQQFTGDRKMVTKPTLTVLAGEEVRDQQMLINLFKKLTGRDPTPEELAEASELEADPQLRDVHTSTKLDDEDPDDEELAETPPEVITVLGFDPKKEW